MNHDSSASISKQEGGKFPDPASAPAAAFGKTASADFASAGYKNEKGKDKPESSALRLHPLQDTSGKPPLVIIAGPTATGKSDAAVDLALSLGGRVISADSMQVYRGCNIGSAKIRPEEQKGVRHYLIDAVDPTEEWNVVRFQKEAKKAIAETYADGCLPILCGGTGFYIQALLYDIDFARTAKDDSFRSEMEEYARKEGPQKLHQLLEKADPAAAARIHPNDTKRIIRALEFKRETGGKISDHNDEERERPAAYNAAFFVFTMDRQELNRRIEVRVDKMFEEGLVDEVKRLQAMGLTEKNVSMQGLGYKEVLRALEGETTMDEAREQIKTATRQFAKRQLTWFRREKGIIWIDRDEFSTPQKLDAALLSKTKETLFNPKKQE